MIPVLAPRMAILYQKPLEQLRHLLKQVRPEREATTEQVKAFLDPYNEDLLATIDSAVSSQLTKLERPGYIRRDGTRLNPESGKRQGMWFTA